jgi:hypothetical protein
VAFAVWWFWPAGAGLTDEMRYLPDDSRFVLSVNVRGTLASAVGQKLASSKVWRDLLEGRLNPDGEGLDALFEKQMGIPFRDITRITAGGNVSDFNRPSQYVTVLKVKDAGRFRFRERRTEFEAGTGKILTTWVDSRCEEETVGRFTLKKGRMDSTEAAYCIPNPETVVFGPVNAVRAALKRDRPAELSSGMREAMAQVDFSSAFAGAITLQDLQGEAGNMVNRARQDVNREFPGLGDSVVALCGEIRMGSHLDLEVTALCKDAKSATKAAEELSRVLKKAQGKVENQANVPQEFVKLITDIRITARGKRVTGSLRLEADQLTRIFERVLEAGPRVQPIQNEQMRQQRIQKEKRQKFKGKFPPPPGMP